MKHPLDNPTLLRSRWLVLSLLLALNTWLAVEAGGGGLLVNDTAGFGIVSLELAATPERARKVVASWMHKALFDRGEPRRSLYFDFAFIPVYSTLLALCCLMAAEAMSGRLPGLARRGTALAWAQYVAALCDVIENCALLRMLPANARTASDLSAVVSPWPQIAALFATLKFIIIVVGLIYILTGLISFGVGFVKSIGDTEKSPS